MIYRAIKGIVMTSVCGQHVLVAAKKARKNCPYITQVNETMASCWRLLEEGCTQDNLTQCLLDEYDEDNTEIINEDVTSMLKQLLEKGYIYAEDMEEQNENE